MPYTINRRNKAHAPSFYQLYRPIQRAMVGMLPLEARGHRPLKMTFDEQLKALIFFHLEEHVSGQHLLQVLEEDDFAPEQNFLTEGSHIFYPNFNLTTPEGNVKHFGEQIAIKASN